MTPGVVVGVVAGGLVGVPATVTPPAGTVPFSSGGAAGFGLVCSGFVVRFGAGLAATCWVGRRRLLAAAASSVDGRRGLPFASSGGPSVEGEVGAAVVAGAGARAGVRAGAGFGADRHADRSNTLAKTTSP
ncbi:MAG: hypothetical protein M3303_13110 [Gemmatimonadota bacterium]|nr:hypothetical protein [Gemmatimonadota bacterium]